MWRHLERPSAGPATGELYAEKVRSMTRRTGPGQVVDPLPGTDLLVVVQTMAAGWFLSPTELLTADGSDPSDPVRLAAHRAALLAAVARVSPPTGALQDTVAGLPRPSRPDRVVTGPRAAGA